MQPELNTLKAKGVDLYIITAGREADIKAFFATNNLDGTVILDTDYSISQYYQVAGVPYNLLIDKHGNVASDHLGWGDSTYEKDILPRLDALLDE